MSITPFHVDLDSVTLSNIYYRRVLYTSKNQQIVVMSIPPGEKIPMEVHRDHDQFIKVEKGEAYINDFGYYLCKGHAVVIPAGVAHEVVNISPYSDLKLYTIYSPPEHPPNRIDVYKPHD